jgi:hypothetical protein
MGKSWGTRRAVLSQLDGHDGVALRTVTY